MLVADMFQMPIQDNCPEGGHRRAPACVRCLKWVALNPEHQLRCFVDGDDDNDDVLDVADVFEDGEPPPRCTRCRLLNKPCELAVSISLDNDGTFDYQDLDDHPFASCLYFVRAWNSCQKLLSIYLVWQHTVAASTHSTQYSA